MLLYTDLAPYLNTPAAEGYLIDFISKDGEPAIARLDDYNYDETKHAIQVRVSIDYASCAVSDRSLWIPNSWLIFSRRANGSIRRGIKTEYIGEFRAKLIEARA